jgi:hypothetical protein
VTTPRIDELRKAIEIRDDHIRGLTHRIVELEDKNALLLDVVKAARKTHKWQGGNLYELGKALAALDGEAKPEQSQLEPPPT